MIFIHDHGHGNGYKHADIQTYQSLVRVELRSKVLIVQLRHETTHVEELEGVVEDIVASADSATHNTQRNQVVLLACVVQLHEQGFYLVASTQLLELLLTHASACVGGDGGSGPSRASAIGTSLSVKG